MVINTFSQRKNCWIKIKQNNFYLLQNSRFQDTFSQRNRENEWLQNCQSPILFNKTTQYTVRKKSTALSQSINLEHQQKQCCYPYQLRYEMLDTRRAYHLNVLCLSALLRENFFSSNEDEFGHVFICGLSLWLVLVLLRRFFSRFSGFPSSTKTNISKVRFNQPAKAHVASSLLLLTF